MISRIEEHLYLGDSKDCQNDADMAKLGVGMVVCVVDAPIRGRSLGIKQIQLPFEKLEANPKWMDDLIEWIDQGTQYGAVAVHCGAGIERSPTVVTLFLMRKRGMSLDDAIKYLKEKRPQISEQFIRERIKPWLTET